MKGAIFDIDGTLLDSMSMWNHAGEWYLARLGIKAEPGLGRRLLPMSMEQAAGYMREQYCLTQTEAEIVSGVEETVSRYYRGGSPSESRGSGVSYPAWKTRFCDGCGDLQQPEGSGGGAFPMRP